MSKRQENKDRIESFYSMKYILRPPKVINWTYKVINESSRQILYSRSIKCSLLLPGVYYSLIERNDSEGKELQLLSKIRHSKRASTQLKTKHKYHMKIAYLT